MNDILKGYAAAATPALIERYEAFDPAALYAPVLDLLPRAPGRVADIGAGTGRDAAWFVRQGHTVLAVEPVQPLREAGLARHGDVGIVFLDDDLPHLARVRDHGLFDLVTLNGVWHHLDAPARAVALPVLANMLRPGGRLVFALRHGPGAPGRPAFRLSDEETIDAAARCDLTLLRSRKAESHQAGNRALGVDWTWMVFEWSGVRSRPLP
ncbi:SAM-dependent methyltransferase [Shinella sp. SUS2]|jgi:SAM-dependent methyltransferase|uniref:class I SAM-dependent methyltransferase n=1 Tax=unclassified Shinella TaxID=2643062 RepID=UPI0003C53560|nr:MULTISPECIES: class I SAM-dependent methyltransferase [unclassified Shinella]MCA0341848.1 class I SAM-dependent methyltransferase [Pseudomonadota bacterium]EYR83678.1 S-adenosyl-L-methionine-dependent methyltransferase [Shinella sp. DD12]KNY18850.1 SAM-dependent methyltransferase [Shinella sp. SUS2]KOC76241.1 SAM-dependent methyltransferase [Shinella sp. GWS1]MDG4671832.1 class I SAM-dependent methyltransferase [Shinella sp. 838]